jgi:hypothetical protein
MACSDAIDIKQYIAFHTSSFADRYCHYSFFARALVDPSSRLSRNFTLLCNLSPVGSPCIGLMSVATERHAMRTSREVGTRALSFRFYSALEN